MVIDWTQDVHYDPDTVTLKRVHNYWRNPPTINTPDNYSSDDKVARSEYIVGKIASVVGQAASVLEIGCNSGRNLAFLRQAGYRNLAGVEISETAVKHGDEMYNIQAIADIHITPIEDIISDLPRYDLIFTCAVLEHIHPDSQWIFEEIAKRCKYLLIIEDECAGSWRQFPRNYYDIFSQFDMVQIGFENNLKGIGLERSFVMRLFRHE